MPYPFPRHGKLASLTCLLCLSLLTACQSPSTPVMAQNESKAESSVSNIESIPDSSTKSWDDVSSIVPEEETSSEENEPSANLDSYVMDMETI